MLTNILVTGGYGYLGNNLIRALDKDHLYRIVAYGHNANKMDNLRNGVGIDGDILDEKNLEDAMVGIDVVIHLAGGGGESHCLDNPFQSLLVNVHGTEILLRVARKLHVKKIIFASSIYVYSSYKKRNIPLHEDDQLVPDSFYGLLKYLCEDRIKESGVKYAICRLSNVYGVGVGVNIGNGAIGNFVKGVVNNSPIYIFNGGTNVIDYLHIDDVVSGISKVLRENKSEVKNKIFNFGGGQPITVQDLAEMIIRKAKVMGIRYSHQLIARDQKEYELSDLVLDIDRSRDELGWAPKVCIDDGVETMIRFSSEQTLGVSNTKATI